MGCASLPARGKPLSTKRFMARLSELGDAPGCRDGYVITPHNGRATNTTPSGPVALQSLQTFYKRTEMTKGYAARRGYEALASHVSRIRIVKNGSAYAS